MTHIRIEHHKQYLYETDVMLAQHLAYLRPVETPWQKRLSSEVCIEPDVDSRHEDVDAFGNSRLFFTLTHAHQNLVVTALSEVRKLPRYTFFDPTQTPAWDMIEAGMKYSLD